MKTPIPQSNRHDARIAQLERVTAALIDLANPEAFRKALAATTARTGLADLAQATAAGQLVQAMRVSPLSIAARFKELRGDELVTPAVVVQFATMDAETRVMFDGKGLGEQITEKEGVRAVLDQVWDRPTLAGRQHRPRGKGRHGRR